jgi:3-hydroxyacyl-CoA dehydrogenase/enoyl-CoA hydratase/3-hydroxybutyryl-CoA epimerase
MVDQGVRRRHFEPREAQQIVQRLSGTTDYSGFAAADLVIEAVFEDLHVKQAVVTDLEATVRPDAIIASNTSALPIEEIARGARHRERIVGMHFFSPAERMPLLEVVQPDAAADWAVASAVALGTRMGKTVIVVADRPGFYTSRVLGVMLNEAALLLAEGARVETVDRAMTEFGFPVGPFVLYDEVGLEVALHAGETVARAFSGRLPTAAVVARLVSAGHTGRKTGIGFYKWPRPSRIPAPIRTLLKSPSRAPNQEVYELLGRPTPKRLETAYVQDRLVILFFNEAIRCLEEGVLRSPGDGDLGAVLGLGFPPFRGGPFHYADALGLPTLVDRLSVLAGDHGRRYAPAALLVDRAGQRGGAFFEE